MESGKIFSPTIISFYSYKGGVGRSQLCANVASYLCHKKGKNVLLWDWDFEAPGLHFFFDKSNEDVTHTGTIEMFDNYCGSKRTNPDFSENDYEFLLADSIVPLAKGSTGKIGLIPGGNYNDDFVFKVNTFNWFEFYEILKGKNYIESLKKWVKTLGYDYILIDSRTGINDYSGICNLQIPDINMVVMAANKQNMLGCKRIIEQIRKSNYIAEGYRQPFIFPILSRINVNNPAYQEWSERFVAEFHDLLPILDNKIEDIFTKEIFRDFYLDKTLLEDVPSFSAGENLLINSKNQIFSRGSFISKYANIGDYIYNLSVSDNIGLSNQIDKEAWVNYAEQAEANEDKPKAAKAYYNAKECIKSVNLEPTVDALFEIGNENFLKEDHTQAILYYEKVISLKPNSFEALNKIGQAYKNKGDFDLAIENYRKCISIKPDYHYAYNGLGKVYKEKSDFDLAIENFRKCISIKPDFHYAYNGLGNVYKEKGDFDSAIENYRKCISIKPDFHYPYKNLGNLYKEKGDFDLAIENFRKCISIKPDYHYPYESLRDVYKEKGDFDLAIENSRK